MSRSPKQMLSFGPLSANSATLPHYIPNGHTFEAPQRVCNASMANMTPRELQRIVPAAPARPGSEDFRRYASRGMG